MQSVSDERRRIGCVHHQPVHFEQPCATWRPSISRECSDEKGRQREAARRSHKDRSCMNSRRRASMDMAMDLEKHGRNLLPGLPAALARPSASSSHRRTCRPRRPNRLRLPKPRCGGDCQHPCPSPSRLSGLLGMRRALAGPDAAAAAANYQNGLAVTALPSAGLTTSTVCIRR